MPKILPITGKFIPISKAAKFLKVSPDTLRNWEKAGKILPSRTYGGARRYSLVELQHLKKHIHPVASRKKGLISISVAAKALRVSSDTLRNWDAKGLIESFRTKGGSRRFTRDEIKRLQKELGIETVSQPLVQERPLLEVPKSSREIPKFTFPWFQMTLFLVLMLVLVISFLISYLNPLESRLESKINETVKLAEGMVGSIESLQRGVLGIQSQPSPSPIILPGSLSVQSANSQTTIVFGSAKAPLNLNSADGTLSCPDCLTSSSAYISSLTNSDGTLGINLTDKTSTVSLNLDHINNWSAMQSFKGGIQINDSTASPVVVNTAGNVGIGITSPINKLDVGGGQTIGAGYAGSYSAPSNGLLVEGNVGIGTSNATLSFALEVNGGARFGCGDNTWSSGPATTCADIAEIYESDGSVDMGEIVIAGKRPNSVSRSSEPYQKGIIGVYSTSPAFIIGGQTILGGSPKPEGNMIPVALAGRAPVKVSDENGPIETGDYLTSSSVPGVAMKATRPGPVVGQALEPFEDIDMPDLEENHLVDIKLNFKKILVFVNVSYADPGNFLASLSLDDSGNLIVPKIKAGSIALDPSTASSSAVILNVSEGSLANARPTSAGDSSQSLQNDNISHADNTFYDLSGKIASLEDRIAALEVRISENSENSVKQNISGSDGQTEATQSADLTQSTASDSGSLADRSSDTSGTPSSSDTLNLTPPDVLLATGSAALADLKVAGTLSSDTLFTAQDGKISGDLNVFGKTTLANTTIAGDLNIDGTLSLTGNSLNNLGTLYIQNSPLAALVDFFNGLVIIDKGGNLRAQSVTVAEFKVVTNKISGSGKIPAGSKFIEIENVLVSPSSRILITPTSETDLVLAVTDKEEGKRFTVSVVRDTTNDINFDWFMVGESLDK